MSDEPSLGHYDFVTEREIISPSQEKTDIESGVSNGSADSILGWDEIFAALDEADFPADFLSDREQLFHDSREPLGEI